MKKIDKNFIKEENLAKKITQRLSIVRLNDFIFIFLFVFSLFVEFKLMMSFVKKVTLKTTSLVEYGN